MYESQNFYGGRHIGIYNHDRILDELRRTRRHTEIRAVYVSNTDKTRYSTHKSLGHRQQRIANLIKSPTENFVGARVKGYKS
jgi:hypothetical protein